jgi:serine/threonine protein kinase/tetratricopeptide (TPR) repeat protein
MSLAPGTRLGPYEVVALIGAGGMGEVYKARDTRLERTVAIKVIATGGVNRELLRERLLREARAASALNHPHICTIHDVGDADGCAFIAMEWIAGESLAQRLTGTVGPLPVADVLRIGAQVADGLAAAHDHGIVHRDLKPANLFMTARGDAKILDFGLAKKGATLADDAATVAAERGLTHAGHTVGTVAYMAPEQARGEAVDARSDLFSFGVVLYEMASGRSAFAGQTTALVYDAILNRQPASLREINRDVPVALDAIVRRLLEKDPASRYQSAVAVKRDIDAVRAGLPIEKGSGVTRTAPSVAVLPFTNLSPSTDDEYIADGITEELITALAQLKGLQVAARTSSFAFKNKTPDLRDVASTLHVAHVLTGSVRRAGSRLRVTAQLVGADDGFPVWSERYDRETDDIFAIQDDIATAIAQQLRVTLVDASAGPIVKRATDNLSAYDLYMKGRFCVTQRGTAMMQGLRHFEDAIALDEGFALAHAGLATTLALLAFYGYLPHYEAMPRARSEAWAAIDLDRTLAEPYEALLLVAYMHDWDWRRAERWYREALALNDRSVSAHIWHALHMAVHGRHDESIAASTRATRIDPLSAGSYAVLAFNYLYARRWDDAIGAADQAQALDPYVWTAGRTRAVAMWQTGRQAEALAAMEGVAVIAQRHHWVLQDLALMYRRVNRPDDTARISDEVLERAKTRYVPPISVGMLLLSIGREDEGWAMIERAYRERDALPVWNRYPLLSEIEVRDDRLAALMRRIGLTPSAELRPPEERSRPA